MRSKSLTSPLILLPRLLLSSFFSSLLFPLRPLFRLGLLILLLPSLSHAAWTFLPDSNHRLYDSWGLFFDEQTVLINYGQARVWTAVGGTMAAYGNEDSPHHPEITFHATANAALHYSDNF